MRAKLQAAIDFLVSYGIAILIIIIAVDVIYNTGILNTLLLPNSCSANPGFSCSNMSINSNGVLYMRIAQATGAALTIQGAGCSTLPSSSNDLPAYGNLYVTNQIAYYPIGTDPYGLVVYSGTSTSIQMYCYSQQGIAKNSYGTAFYGYVWLNYTLPAYGKIVQQIASINLKYT